MDPLRSRLATARARHALRDAGLPFEGELQRASSTNNEIYISDRYVIRTNTEMNSRLSREAMLYPFLPEHPGSPVSVATGGEVGADYLIIERKPGMPLAHVWPDLDRDQRRNTVHQLASYLELLHHTQAPIQLPRLRRTPQLLDGQALPPTAPLLAAIRDLEAKGEVDGGVLADLTQLTQDSLPHLDGFDELYLVHGDLTFENLLWHRDGLSAVVDFEWCRGAPADLDLDVLLRCCAHPDLHVGADHVSRTHARDYAEIPSWVAEVYPALFAHPQVYERAVLYAISFEVRQLLLTPINGPRHSLDPDHPYRRVVALLQDGGYVAEMLRTVGVAC